MAFDRKDPHPSQSRQSQSSRHIESHYGPKRISPGKRSRTDAHKSGPASPGLGGHGPVQRKAGATSNSAPAPRAKPDPGLVATGNWTVFGPHSAAQDQTPVQRKSEAVTPDAGTETRPAQFPKTDEPIPTRAEVEANPEAYGIPEGGNPQDWFNEYVAHTLAYMDPAELDLNALDPNASDFDARRQTIMRHRGIIEGWGYDPDNIAFINDSRSGDNETGLQAVRLDPLNPDSEHGSVVGFRGTEPFAAHQSTLTNPTGAFDDIAADLGRDIGGNQYRENQQRIQDFMAAGTGPMTVTGHSLGGALAQHAAAGATDLDVANVVGFQAPGIDRASARAFDQANADGHIDVRFHEHENDVVHRAGEQKLAGTHYTWSDSNDPGVGGAHTSNFMYNDVDSEGNAAKRVGAGSSATASESDPIANRMGWEGGRRLVGGVGNMVASPFQGAFALGQGLGEAGVNAGEGLVQSGEEFVGGVREGGSTIGSSMSQGASQIGDGNVLSGLGTMTMGTARGVGEMAVGVGQGLAGVGKTGAGLVMDAAGAVWEGTKTTATHLADGVGTLARGVGNLAEWGVDAVTDLFSSDDDKEKRPGQ